MRCPYCGSLEDKVIESRQNMSGTNIRRRRECVRCGYRFTSYERIEEKPLMVVKRDNRREPFDIRKLESRIQLSLAKRPVTQTSIEEMLQEIEDEAMLVGKHNHEVPAEEIGAMVLRKLFKIDEVAYVRFASVYRKFEEVEEFIQEIEKFSKEP